MFDEAEIRAKVRCCACHGPLGRRLNLVTLDRKATWEFPTAGNVLSGEEGEACAIVCDQCVDGKQEIIEAVEFAGGEVVYHSVDELEKIER